VGRASAVRRPTRSARSNDGLLKCSLSSVLTGDVFDWSLVPPVHIPDTELTLRESGEGRRVIESDISRHIQTAISVS